MRTGSRCQQEQVPQERQELAMRARTGSRCQQEPLEPEPQELEPQERPELAMHRPMRTGSPWQQEPELQVEPQQRWLAEPVRLEREEAGGTLVACRQPICTSACTRTHTLTPTSIIGSTCRRGSCPTPIP